MNIKRLIYGLLIVFALGAATIPSIAEAGNVFEEAYGNLTNTTTGRTNIQTAPLPQLIGAAIKGVLGVLGIAGIIIFIYSGFLYLTSRGKTETIERAKKQMLYTAIGMGVILGSYIITDFVISQIIAVRTTQ